MNPGEVVAEAIDDINDDDGAVVGSIRAIANALQWLGTGDAATRMGALEAHGLCIKEAGESIAGSINNLADAIREAAENGVRVVND